MAKKNPTVMAWNVSVCARRTPLHAAAFAEDVAGLQLVLRHGAEINTVDRSGCSALMVAADKGHSGTVGESLTCYSCRILKSQFLFKNTALYNVLVIGLNRSLVHPL